VSLRAITRYRSDLFLVQPVGPRRRPLGERRLARQDEAGRLRTGSDRPGNAPEHDGPAFSRPRNGLRITTGAKKNPAGCVGTGGVKEVHRF
jgi:hypothetical protein